MNLILLEPKGVIALIEKNIILTSVALMLLVVIPVIVLTLTFAWRYRESNNQAVYSPKWCHNTWLEIIWWSIPCVIIGILGTITFISSHTLDPYQPIASTHKRMQIQVIALDWKWLFIYPAYDIASVNYVAFPVNVPVEFTISAEGAMNSFQIPQLGSQIYAMAGMQTKLNLIANEIGDYRGQSTNFSGDGFSDMKFTAHISTQPEFDQWVQKVKQTPRELSLLNYQALTKPSVFKEPAVYAKAASNLFDMVVMKAMMPISLEEIAKCDQKTLTAMKNKNFKVLNYAE